VKLHKSYFGKRAFDILFASCLFVPATPLILAGMCGILISSPGSIFYQALRVGKDGRIFSLYKLRTMRQSGDSNYSAITSFNDQRVFPFGGLLRKYKIDELPQLINVLKGDMAVVGPRPEDVGIVEAHYTQRDLETLNVRPGLTSPGTIYYYTDLERTLADDVSETAYVERVLPEKLAIDHVYLERQSLWYDIRIIFRTAIAIITITLGRSASLRPPELDCIDDEDIDSGTCSRRN